MKIYYRFDSREQMDQLVTKYGADYFGFVPPSAYSTSGFLIHGEGADSWHSCPMDDFKAFYPEAQIVTFEEAMKNNFKKGDKVICVDTTYVLDDKLVLGEVYTVSHVWEWGNIDVQNHRGETLRNYKSWRFKSFEIARCITIREDHYQAIIEENKKLKSSISTLQEDLVFQDKMIKKFVDAGQIFQSGGKYSKEANLPIGSSCVIEGIKWMDSEIERLKKELKIAQNRLDKIKTIL